MLQCWHCKCEQKKFMKRKFIRRGEFHVYILECCDGTFYTGSTNDLARRFDEHNNGKGGKYTRSRKPVKLIWSKSYRNFRNAFLEEVRIKKLTRKEKEELIGIKSSIKKRVKKSKSCEE